MNPTWSSYHILPIFWTVCNAKEIIHIIKYWSNKALRLSYEIFFYAMYVYKIHWKVVIMAISPCNLLILQQLQNMQWVNIKICNVCRITKNAFEKYVFSTCIFCTEMWLCEPRTFCIDCSIMCCVNLHILPGIILQPSAAIVMKLLHIWNACSIYFLLLNNHRDLY